MLLVPSSARERVGPYVPAPWRGKPTVAGTDATPRPVRPLVVETIVASGMSAADMPPSYPTPAYFTPLASRAQDDLVMPGFDVQDLGDDHGGLDAISLTEPEGVLARDEPSLPWIDNFLSATPAIPMRAVDAPVAAYTPQASQTIIGETVVSEWTSTDTAPDAPTLSDAWALDDAAEQMLALADELRAYDTLAGTSGDAARLFDASSSPEPLPAWSDDDMIDIMPVQHERSSAPNRVPPPTAEGALEHWADRARRSGNHSTEAAAHALDVLAQRVRDGEISLAGYDPRLGEAAALAAALAALLGVRR